MIDKNLCMSSYLALRYIEKSDVHFTEKLVYRRPSLRFNNDRILVYNAQDINNAIEEQLDSVKKDYKKIGILLSGGMDSAILASYLSGCDAYTFRFLNGEYQKDELKKAEIFAEQNDLRLHYVDINWDIVLDSLKLIMISKGGPVHSIEPQIYQGAKMAIQDGVDLMIIGDGSDYVFGGMDQLLSKDWAFDEFYHRYIYIEPEAVLKEPVSVKYVFERYRQGDGIDFQGFMNQIATEESYGSYANAFLTAGLDYYDPYENLMMAEPLNLERIRKGESKYLVRELFKMRYPDIQLPEKVPMPRPVEQYFSEWKGPNRAEFRDDIDISRYNGNQKWLMWNLEQFLNMIDEM